MPICDVFRASFWDTGVIELQRGIHIQLSLIVNLGKNERQEQEQGVGSKSNDDVLVWKPNHLNSTSVSLTSRNTSNVERGNNNQAPTTANDENKEVSKKATKEK